jgi:hypothetical protein
VSTSQKEPFFGINLLTLMGFITVGPVSLCGGRQMLAFRFAAA